MKRIYILLLLCFPLFAITPPVGFNEVPWGSAPATVQSQAKPKPSTWTTVPATGMPTTLPITAFSSQDSIAGYKATTTYFFYQNKLFQATTVFNFDDLKNFDFNYNVFLSVDRYYQEIRKRTLTFVADIYSLLNAKYGKKQPLFMPLDPSRVLMDTDNYIGQERWNLRYHPSEYYKRIIGRAYARWTYPKTEINFAVNISASDKRFDYTLNYVSTDLRKQIENDVKTQRGSGL